MTGGHEVLLLGPVALRRGAASVVVPGARLQGLLALLALSAPRPVSDDRLIDELWGDEQPANPANALQSRVSQLRRVLGPDAVARDGRGYALVLNAEQVDATRMERLVARAREAAGSGDHRGAAQHFSDAISLVRGPPLGELLDHRFARDAAVRLEQVLVSASEGLADALLAAGRHAEVVASHSELVRRHPLHERFAAQLMVALYRCGRQSEALRAYTEVRTALIEEMGVEPGVELRSLEQAVLAHDPSLLGAPPDPPPQPVATREAAEMAELAETKAPPPPPPRHEAPPASTHALPLVGREAELRLLQDDLADVVAGRGRVTLLAEELAALAQAAGATVVWGRCYEGRGAPAFWPWTQVVQELVARTPGDDVVRALGRGAADLAQVVPDLLDVVPGIEPPPPALDPEAARFRVYQALTRFLRSLSASRPLVVVLDDVHWADPASLELLSFLAGDLTAAPLLIVSTCRTVGAPTDSHLDATLVDLNRRPIVRRIDLSGLDLPALAALVASRGASASDEVLATMHRRTQGNPFFVAEIMRLLPADSNLDDVATVRQLVPTGVRDLIRQRMRRLPEATADVLKAASVLGRDFELSLLAGTAAAEGATMQEALEPAIESGIVLYGTEGPGSYRFSHGLVNETIYGDLRGADRARLHHLAAQALEARHGGVDGAHLAAMATHWFNAVPAAAPERGIECAVRSAHWAQAHVAHDQAEDHLRMALALLALTASGPERDQRELEIQSEIGYLVLVTAGLAARALEPVFARITELCQVIEDHALLVPALWLACSFYRFRSDLDTSLAIARRLLELAGPEARPWPLLVGELGLGSAFTQRGDVVDGRRHLDVALGMCDAGIGTDIPCVPETPAIFALVFSAPNRWLCGDEDGAEEDVRRMIALAADLGPVSYPMTIALWGGVLIAALRGDAALALGRAERCIEVATASGFGISLPFVRAYRGWAIAAEGDVEVGLASLVAHTEELRASGARMMLHHFSTLQAEIYLTAGRPEQALAAVAEGLALVTSTGERTYEAELHRLRGEVLAVLDAGDPRVAESLRRAVEVAAAQGAIGLQRRAEASLARVVPATAGLVPPGQQGGPGSSVIS